MITNVLSENRRVLTNELIVRLLRFVHGLRNHFFSRYELWGLPAERAKRSEVKWIEAK